MIGNRALGGACLALVLLAPPAMAQIPFFRGPLDPSNQLNTFNTLISEINSQSATGGILFGNDLQRGGDGAGSQYYALGGQAATSTETFRIDHTVTQPTAENVGFFMTLNVLLTGDNAQDVLGSRGDVALNQSGHHNTSQHDAGGYFQGYTTGATGTADFINGVVGLASNQGAGTLTTGRAFLAHSPVNNGGGTYTNYFAFSDEGACLGLGITNCYGGQFSNPVAFTDLDSPPTPSAGYTVDVQHGKTRLAGQLDAAVVSAVAASSTHFLQRTGSAGTVVEIDGGANSSDDQGGQLRLNNVGGGSNPNKFFRVTHLGNLQVMNSGYSTAILDLSDAGLLTIPTLTMSAIATSAGAGGLYVCIDTAGVTYKKATCP